MIPGLSTLKLGLIAGGAIAALALGGWAFHAIQDSGVQKERARIEDANKASEEKADAGQATFDDCIRAGRMWDRARGVCLRPGQ
jgi:hypothetical protein